MITAEKIKQVRKQLRSGVPQGEIKNELVKEGYTEEDIDKVFVAHRPDMRSWYLVFAIVFLLVGLYQFVTNSTGLFILFAGAMFVVYYFETKRVKKTRT